MAITGITIGRQASVTTVTVISDLSGTIYYHWYIDGAFVGTSLEPMHCFALQADDQVRFAVIDTTDANYDPVANAPAGWPARRSIWWLRAGDTSIARYRVEQKKGAGSWTIIGYAEQAGAAWMHDLLTERLEDLETHQWRVIPIDEYGNDGTACILPAEKIVRRPDAPDFTVSFDSGTSKVTFAAA